MSENRPFQFTKCSHPLSATQQTSCLYFLCNRLLFVSGHKSNSFSVSMHFRPGKMVWNYFLYGFTFFFLFWLHMWMCVWVVQFIRVYVHWEFQHIKKIEKIKTNKTSKIGCCAYTYTIIHSHTHTRIHNTIYRKEQWDRFSRRTDDTPKVNAPKIISFFVYE